MKSIAPRFFLVFIISIISILAATVALADDSAKTSGNSIPVINSPGKPPGPLQTIQCRELWRTGGEDEVGDAPLGFITDIEIDQDGITYLLDSSSSCIHIFDPSGTWQRSIGRQGNGPGEFTRAERFLLLPDNDLGILQPMSAKVVGLSRDGLPVPNVAFRGNEGLQFIGLIDAVKNRVIVDLTETVSKNNETFVVETLATYDREGNPRSVILERMTAQSDQGALVDPDGNSSFGDCWQVDANGNIFVYRRPHEYQVEVFSLAGVPQQIITRDYTPVKLSKEELDKENERVDRLHRMTRGSGITFEVDPFKRDITGIFPRPSGDLWVSTSRGALERSEGTIGLFDVFDARGHFTHQTRLQVDYNPDRDNFELIGDRLFVFKEGQMRPSFVSESDGMTLYYDNENLESVDQEDEEAQLAVICYQLLD